MYSPRAPVLMSGSSNRAYLPCYSTLEWCVTHMVRFGMLRYAMLGEVSLGNCAMKHTWYNMMDLLLSSPVQCKLSEDKGKCCKFWSSP